MREKFEPSPEEGDVEKVEISGEEFLGILSSQDFLKALKTASRETQKSGHEAGFHMQVNKDKTHRVSEVTEGGTDFIQHEYQEEMDGYNREPTGSLMDLHLHPTIKGAIEPSSADLNLAGDFAFLGVGAVKKDGNVDVLLIRKKSFVSDSEIPENADRFDQDAWDPNMSQEEVMRHLDENGFENFLISFEKDRRSLKLNEQSENTILGIKKVKSKIL